MIPAVDRARIERHADDAGRGDQHLFGFAAEGARRLGGHQLGHLVPGVAGAGVGAAAVDDDGARAAAGRGEVRLRHEDRRRDGLVDGEHRRRRWPTSSATSSARSRAPARALMPQCTPAARKPAGAVTPPGTTEIAGETTSKVPSAGYEGRRRRSGAVQRRRRRWCGPGAARSAPRTRASPGTAAGRPASSAASGRAAAAPSRTARTAGTSGSRRSRWRSSRAATGAARSRSPGGRSAPRRA